MEKSVLLFYNKQYQICSFHILVADREFIGEIWFDFLVESNILFVIRIRENMYQKELLDGKICALASTS